MSQQYPIPRTTRAPDPAIASAGQTDFVFPFWLHDGQDVEVRIKPVGAADYGPPLVFGVDYTALNLDQNGGATIRLTVPRAAGDIVSRIGRRLPTRTTSVVQGGTIRSYPLELELDLLNTTQQELRRDADQNALDVTAHAAQLEEQASHLVAIDSEQATQNSQLLDHEVRLDGAEPVLAEVAARAVRVPGNEPAVYLPGVSQRALRYAAYGAGGAPVAVDAPGVIVGNGFASFSSALAAAGASIPTDQTFFSTLGRLTINDGGDADYAKVDAEPAHGLGVSLAGGKWGDPLYRPRMRVAVSGAVSGNPGARAAIQKLIDFVASFGGGDVDLTGGRWLIDDDHLYVRKGVRLVGPWEMIGEVEGLDYSTIKGALVLANGKELRLWEDFSAVRGVVILRDGLTKPTNLRQTLDLVKNMSGVAVRIGDGTNSKANDGYVGHCIILGFDQAVYCDYSERPTIEFVRGDCRNGIYTKRIYDLQTVRSCHFWPFLTVRGSQLFGPTYQFAISNVVDNGSGACRVTCSAQPGVDGDVVIVAGAGGVTGANGRFTLDVIDENTVDLVGSTFAGSYSSGGNVIFPWNSRFGKAYFFDTDTDWAEAVDCFSYGYDKGFEVKDVGRATLVNCGADHTPSFQDKTTIAFHLNGNDRAPVLLGCKGSAVGTSVKVETTATVDTTAQIIGHRAWGIQNYAYWFADGDANLIGCEANASAILRFEDACGRISISDGVFPTVGLSNYNAQAAAGKIAVRNTVGMQDVYLQPAGSLKLSEAANSSEIWRAATDGEGWQRITQRERGTLAAPEAVQVGDNVCDDWFQAFDGAAMIGSMRWRVFVETVTAGRVTLSLGLYGLDPATGAERLRLRIDHKGNVILGDAALSAGATDGFLYIPSIGSTPGVPTAISGRVPLAWNSATGKLIVYSGGSWVDV